MIFTYLVSNFSFKDHEIVPPASHVIVFHYHIRELHHKEPAPHIDIKEAVMDLLSIDKFNLDVYMQIQC